MSDAVIRAKSLGKLYRIGEREPYKTLRDALAKPFDRLFSRDHGNPRKGGEYIWALKDLTFEVKRGQVLGIIGPNGAGKTTLLKVLSRVTEPTEGYAEVHGKVGSLLEVGTGFHPELTGRENIYLNGAILGMRRHEIDRRFDEIVAFSGLEEFLDTPVKRYSTGMYLRLAFAVAVHLDSDILLVDEVLAVGDAAFQRRCLGKVEQVSGGGRTVLFVSHNLAAIKSITDTVMWLDKGRLIDIGDPTVVTDKYVSGIGGNTISAFYGPEHIDSNRVHATKYLNQIILRSVRILDENNQTSYTHVEGSTVFLELTFSSCIYAQAIDVVVSVRTMEGQLVFTCLPGKKEVEITPGTYRAIVGFNLGPLLPGIYWGDILLLTHIPQDRVNCAFRFETILDADRSTDSRYVTYSSPLGAESAHRVLGLVRTNSVWKSFENIDGEG